MTSFERIGWHEPPYNFHVVSDHVNFLFLMHGDGGHLVFFRDFIELDGLYRAWRTL